jgi:hypothetical protein
MTSMDGITRIMLIAAACVVFACAPVTAGPPGPQAEAPLIAPVNPSVNQGDTVGLICTANCGTGGTWSCSGCAGTIEPVTGLYTAPPTVNVQQGLGGYQLMPNNHIYNTRVDAAACPSCTASPVSGMGSVPFNILPSFPINYTNNATPTVALVSRYTPGNDGTYQMPTSNNGLSGLIEGGWYLAAHNIGGGDHHLLRLNQQTGELQEQYQWVPGGFGCSQGTCNTVSDVKYQNADYTLPGCPAAGSISSCTGTTDAAGLPLQPLILRRQELDEACTTGGSINHALRLTVQGGYVSNAPPLWPATTPSFSGGGTNPYGERFRLKSSFNISVFSSCAQVILTELQEYGVILADIGYGWQHNAELAPWSEADIAVLHEINDAQIDTSNWEQVDTSSLMIGPTSGEANVNRETVCYTTGGQSGCTDVVLQGVTVGLLQDELDIMAGTPSQQLQANMQGSANTALTWTMSPSIGSLDSATGLYTPPQTLSAESTVTVTATSVANPTAAAMMTIKVWPNGAAYALPSYSSGNDFTDSHGHVWKSGAGIGINDTGEDIGCCAGDHAGDYTGPPMDAPLWNHLFTGSYEAGDFHIYWLVPAGAYALTYNVMAPAAPGAGTNNVTFIAQGSMLAENVDLSANGVGQYGPYTRTDALTVGCDNQLTYDVQAANASPIISSFSILQTSAASCGGPPPNPQ